MKKITELFRDKRQLVVILGSVVVIAVCVVLGALAIKNGRNGNKTGAVAIGETSLAEMSSGERVAAGFKYDEDESKSYLLTDEGETILVSDENSTVTVYDDATVCENADNTVYIKKDGTILVKSKNDANKVETYTTSTAVNDMVVIAKDTIEADDKKIMSDDGTILAKAEDKADGKTDGTVSGPSVNEAKTTTTNTTTAKDNGTTTQTATTVKNVTTTTVKPQVSTTVKQQVTTNKNIELTMMSTAESYQKTLQDAYNKYVGTKVVTVNDLNNAVNGPTIKKANDIPSQQFLCTTIQQETKANATLEEMVDALIFMDAFTGKKYQGREVIKNIKGSVTDSQMGPNGLYSLDGTMGIVLISNPYEDKIGVSHYSVLTTRWGNGCSWGVKLYIYTNNDGMDTKYYVGVPSSDINYMYIYTNEIAELTKYNYINKYSLFKYSDFNGSQYYYENING